MSTAKPSTELAKPQDLDIDTVTRALLEGGELPVEDPEAVMRQIAARILSAESVDDILGAQAQANSWREYIGVPVRVEDVRYRRSAFDEGNPVFAVVSAYNLDTGELVTLTTSASNPLLQLIALQRKGAFPIDVELHKTEKPTANGYYPQWLTRADEGGPER